MTGESREGDVGHGLRWRWKPRVKPAPVPPPPPEQAPAVFHGATAFIANMDDYAIEYLPLLDGFKSLAMKTLHGTTPVPVRTDRLAQFRAADKTILSWSWCTGDNPLAEGAEAAHACAYYGFAGHWANAEKAFDLTAADGSQSPAHFARSSEWLRGWFDYWRAIGKTPVPLGVSPEPFSGFDAQAWIEAGAAIGFQAYTAENHATIPACVLWHMARGWQPGQMIPFVEPVFQGRETPAASFVTDAKHYGLPGLVLYPADQLVNRPDIYQAIAGIGR